MEGFRFVFVLAIFGMLLFAGCAGEKPKEEKKGEEIKPIEEKPVEPPPVLPNETPIKNETVPPVNETPVQPPVQTVSCRVEFQKASSDIFLIEVLNVKPADAKVTVLCPNNDMGADRGNGLFFCGGLSADLAVIAYANGKECGKGNFSIATVGFPQDLPTGPNASGCTVVLAKPTIRAGESVYVDIGYYIASQASSAEYSCGDRTMTAGSGLVRETAYCKFSTVGNYNVWLKVDGKECASAPLKVE